ncbi:MAG: hypothetical protein JHC46_01715 [Solirubrobacteraceae bacterium]|nr:hypothetical protein [Solirubrobacteraceae bacterium]
MKHLRAAEWAVLIGSIGILATLRQPWFSYGVTLESFPAQSLNLTVTGWDGLGWLMVALLVISALLGVGLFLTFAANGRDALTLPFGATLGAVAVPTLIALMVVLFTRPGLGLNLPASDVGIEPAGWIGAISMVVLTAGSLVSIRNERTEGASRAYSPPSPRPAPTGVAAVSHETAER